MSYTSPNQKIIHINREKVTDNFLQIKKENWYNANKDLEPYGLQLYLYLKILSFLLRPSRLCSYSLFSFPHLMHLPLE